MSTETKTEIDLGPRGREVMEAFIRAAAHGFIDDVQDMHVPIGAIQALIGGSKHSVDGAIGHLLDADILAPIVVDDPDTNGFMDGDNWYSLTVKGAGWVVAERLVPNELVAAFFPHTTGWTEELVGHLPGWGEVWQDELGAWGKSRFPEDDRFRAAKAAYERELDQLFG